MNVACKSLYTLLLEGLALYTTEGYVKQINSSNICFFFVFFQYGFDHFYDANAPGDKCTLHSDRVLINRRNVRTDVSKKVDACKQFFELEVKSRIIAATL